MTAESVERIWVGDLRKQERSPEVMNPGGGKGKNRKQRVEIAKDKMAT
jgi:hypothetical protein